MEFFSFPDEVQTEIISFLDLQDLFNFQRASKKCLNLSTQNFFWYEKFQNDFPYQEFRFKFDNNIQWKKVYQNYNIKCDGTYLNYGIITSLNNNGYSFTYLLQTSKVKKFRKVIGKESTFLIFGIQVANMILFFQYKLSKDYYAAVISTMEKDSCTSRWITDQRVGYAISSKKETNVKSLMENIKKVPEVKEKLSYDFISKYQFKKTSKIYQFEIKPTFHKLAGWSFRDRNQSFRVDGVFDENYLMMVIDWNQKEIEMIILFVDKEKKVENWEGYIAKVEDNPKFEKFLLLQA